MSEPTPEKGLSRRYRKRSTPTPVALDVACAICKRKPSVPTGPLAEPLCSLCFAAVVFK